ncbi:hypothetical protein [Streptomyces microflavus]|uniref:hypothetical protein n=1 Tax=Streptomyces microflavus TaxID=1919 RepID=UPI003866B896|nr:hypothetical protein OH770_22400 [Streptomyces microflavus]
MSGSTGSARRALLLAFAGIGLTVVGSALASVTGNDVWRVLAVLGGLAQAAGWVLYLRRIKRGAR